MQEWRITEPGRLDLSGVGRLELRIVSGAVDVVGVGASAGNADGVLEVSEVDGVPLLVRLDPDGTLTVTHERLTWQGLLDWFSSRKARVVLSVAVPESCSAAIGVVDADAVVSGLAGATVSVRSVSGGVTLDSLRTDVTAQTVSGDLEARDLHGRLRFTTVSGDLTVAGGGGDEVSAQSVSGAVTVDVASAPPPDMNVNTVSGDLVVRLPAGSGLDVEVRTVSGSLDTAVSGLRTERKPGRVSLSGSVGASVGSPGRTLRARTVSGDVAVLVREPA